MLAISAGGCLAEETAEDDFKLAVQAYKRSDFTTAVSMLSGLAEAGDKRAQFALGLLYDNGEGVTEDDEKAAHWYRLSAE